MNRSQIINFNKAYSYEPTQDELSFIGDMMTILRKLEPGTAKNPAAIRKGIIFGLGIAAAMHRGEICISPVKKNDAVNDQHGRNPDGRQDGQKGQCVPITQFEQQIVTWENMAER